MTSRFVSAIGTVYNKTFTAQIYRHNTTGLCFRNAEENELVENKKAKHHDRDIIKTNQT